MLALSAIMKDSSFQVFFCLLCIIIILTLFHVAFFILFIVVSKLRLQLCERGGTQRCASHAAAAQRQQRERVIASAAHRCVSRPALAAPAAPR